MSRFLYSIALIAVTGLVGCGGADRPKLVEVSGQVKLNGEPVSGASVSMVLDPPDPNYGRPARGATDATGTFQPNTYGDQKGIPPGKYKVAVIKQEVPDNYNAEDPQSAAVNFTWVVPKVFSDPETSGIVVEVTSAGMNPAVIELEGTSETENTVNKRRSNEP